MNYFLQGFGVFLGVVAGVIVMHISQWLNERLKEKQKVKNLKFEFMLNIKKIDSWLEEIGKYRNAVNGDTLQTYFGYFDLSRFVSVTANDMFLSGLLYKYLEHDDIARLQPIYAEFSLPWENMLNQQITTFRELAVDYSSWLITKPQVVSHVNFWEGKLREHQRTLEEVLKKLE